MEDQTKIRLSVPEEMYIIQIQALTDQLNKANAEISSLSSKLDYERELRERASQQASTAPEPKKKSTKKREVTQETHTYSDFKSNGVRKPHAADSIRSYSDFKKMQDYYLEHNSVRNWALWTIGVSLGLRISDLLSLKWKNVLEADKKTYRKRIEVYEIKTGKLQNCLITEAVRDALDRYLGSLQWSVSLDDYMFPSGKTGGKMYEEYGWRLLSNAGKALNLPIVIASHTMRKSFANIAACVDKSSVDMNSITKVQGLLNHSDQSVTMKYLGSYQDMYDRARIAVSDFVLGRSGVDTIVAGNQFTTDDVMSRLDALEQLLSKKGISK